MSTDGYAEKFQTTKKNLSNHTNTITTSEEVFAALQTLSPDLSRDEWVRVAMAVKDGLGEAGFGLFDSWSSTGASYNSKEAASVWKSVETGGGITKDTLFFMARNKGYRERPLLGKGRVRDSNKYYETNLPREEGYPVIPLPEEMPQGAAAVKKVVDENTSGIIYSVVGLCQHAQGDHPYLQRKKVRPSSALLEIGSTLLERLIGYKPKGKGGVLLLPGRILVAPITSGGKMTALEFIDESGNKTTLAGGVRAGGVRPGGCFIVDPAIGVREGTLLFIGEGVATVLTAYQAFPESMCFAAFANTNLPAVAMILKEKYPTADVVILADIEKKTNKPDPYAFNAAVRIGGRLAVPDFGPDRKEGCTDFNDLLVHHGQEKVREHLLSAKKVRMPEIVAGKEGISLGDLLQKDFPEPRWAVPGLLPEGVSILGGAPKIGKSWLAMHIHLAIATGGQVMEKVAVTQGTSLYLALEDNQRRLKQRCEKLLDRMSYSSLEDAYFFTEWPRMGQGGEEALDGWLSNHPDCRLVIIDTLAKVRPMRGARGDLYQEDYTIGEVLKPLADKHQVSLLLVHHLRKTGSDDPLQMLSGTMGLAGGMDAILILGRQRSKNEVTLFVTGRDIEEEKCHSLLWVPSTCSWELLDDARLLATTEEQRAILALLSAAPEGLLLQELADSLGKSRDTVRRAIGRMLGVGMIAKHGPHKATRYSVVGGDDALKGPAQKSFADTLDGGGAGALGGAAIVSEDLPGRVMEIDLVPRMLVQDGTEDDLPWMGPLADDDY